MRWRRARPARCVQARRGSRPEHCNDWPAATIGPTGGLTPSDLTTAYAFSSTATGTGQTVAIIDAYNDPNINADLQTFDTKYGLATCSEANGCLKVVNQTGGSTLPANDTTGWSVEESLDVETVHSVCQNCKIILVEANSESNADLATAVNEAATLKATEITNSYGSYEADRTSTQNAAYNHRASSLPRPLVTTDTTTSTSSAALFRPLTTSGMLRFP